MHYYVSDADVDETLSVKVSFIDGNDNEEGPLTSTATGTVTATYGVKVPWSGTVTMDAGAQYTGYSSARISSDASLAPATLSVLDNTYTVGALRYDDTGTNLELSVSPKFPLRFTLLAAGLDPLNSTSSTATDLAAPLDNVTCYLWDQTDPGWAEGDRVAFAIRVNKSFPPTGAPSISGTVADGETLTVVTSAIGDPNGLTSPTFTYQWERVDCATTADNGVIAGQTAQTYTVGAADTDCSIKVTVTFKDDDGYEHSLSDSITGDPGVRIRPSSLTIDEGSTAEYTIRLQSEPTADVTVTLNTASIAGTGLSTDKTSLTFTTTNWNTGQAVTLTAAHDDDIDDVENLQITHSVSSSDSDYQGIPVDTVQVTIIDDDQIVELAEAANEVTEGETINFGFRRKGNVTQQIQVHFNITQQGSFAPGDSIGPQAVTIPAGITFGSFGITTDNDTDEEPDGSITLEITSDAAYSIGDRSSATVTVLDNEQLPEPPTRLGTSLEQDSVIISWTPGDSGLLHGHPASITSYQWRRSIAGASDWNPDWTTITGGNRTSLIDNAAQLGPSTYRYEIRAVTEVGQSDAASIDYQLPPLVANLDQSTATTTVTPRAAQSFVTGTEQGGYALHSVSIHTSLPGAPSAVSVSIYSDSSGNPGSEVHALTNPGTFTDGTNIFTAPENTVLSANTTYHVVVEYSASDAFAVHQTASTSETGQPGWSIGDQHHANTPWASQADPLRIQVNGVTVPPVPKTPRYLRALAGDATIRLVWDTPPGAVVVTHHQYRVSSDFDSVRSAGWVDIPDSATGGANHNSFTVDTGVVNGGTYVFQVRAVNVTDYSHASNAASATPRTNTELLTETFQVSGGCNNANPQRRCSDTNIITGNRFTYGGLQYELSLLNLEQDQGITVEILYVGSPEHRGQAHHHLEEMKERMSIQVGSVTLALNERDALQQNSYNRQNQSIRAFWDRSGINELGTGTFRLISGEGLAVDYQPPALDAAVGHAGRIRLEFSETLDPMSLPGTQSFSATVNGSPRKVTAVTASFNKNPVTGGRHENQVYLTLASVAADTDTVTVSYTPPERNPLRDIAANRVRAFNDVNVLMQS